MSNAFVEVENQANLRQRAAEKLISGIPAASKRASQSDALAVLHHLASSPATAGDAMALLHELQVYQVELDLQQEELRRSQSELEAALMRQASLVERAPASYMTLDAKTVLCEINLAGARLLGTEREHLLGRPLAGLLADESVGVLQALLESARQGRGPENGVLQLGPVAGMGAGLTVQAAVDQDTTPDRFLLVLMPMATAQPRQPGK